ncbi:hypothetical protein E4U54_002523, partial [Claviceps lovelessii]
TPPCFRPDLPRRWFRRFGPQCVLRRVETCCAVHRIVASNNPGAAPAVSEYKTDTKHSLPDTFSPTIDQEQRQRQRQRQWLRSPHQPPLPPTPISKSPVPRLRVPYDPSSTRTSHPIVSAKEPVYTCRPCSKIPEATSARTASLSSRNWTSTTSPCRTIPI